MMDLKRINNFYSTLFETVFFLYVMGMVSFGRIFAIYHFKIGKIPFFVTEMVIVCSIPYVFIQCKKLLNISKIFFCFAGAFFIIGMYHLGQGVFSGNLFALRGAVISVYLFFILISFLVFQDKANLKRFLVYLVFGNFLAIALFKYFLFLVVFPCIGDINWFFSASNMAIMKGYNFGLYANIFIAFLLSFSGLVKNKIYRICFLVLLSLDIYIIVSMLSRSSVIAFCCNIIFLLLFIRGKNLKSMIYYLFISIILVAIVQHVDFNLSNASSFGIHGSRLKSIVEFSEKIVRKVFRFDNQGKVVHNIDGEELGSVDSLNNNDMPRAEWAKKETAVNKFMESILDDRKSIKNRRKTEAYSNAYWRMVVWVQSIEFAMEKPIFGKGFGVYPDYRLEQNQKMTNIKKDNFAIYSGVLSPHNHLIFLFMNMGLVGLFSFLSFNIYVFVCGVKGVVRSKSQFLKQYMIAALCSFVSWHALALLFDVIDSPMTNVFLWIFIGVILALRQHIEKESQLVEGKHV